MKINLFTGKLPVNYGQFYITYKGKSFEGMEECFLKQKNGLCGAAFEGTIFFMTACSVGKVQIAINVYETEPSIDKSFQDMFEVSVELPESGLTLIDWNRRFSRDLGGSRGSHRIRYSAKTPNNQLSAFIGLGEFYQIDIWPDSKNGDRIIKESKDFGAYWHKWVSTLNA